MKSILFLFFSFLFTTSLMAQTTYYVSREGDDTRSGTQPENAWQSLSKVNELRPNPGDQILFKRGDAWEGTLAVPVSGSPENPIVYGAYGQGNKPRIYSSLKVTGWNRHSENIFSARVDGPDIKQLFLNGNRMKLARYPDQGYFTIDSVVSSTEYSSDIIDGSIDYTGAVAIIRVNEWSLYARKVQSSNTHTITLDSATGYPLVANFGFWLTNKLQFLNEAGEWYYDNAEKMIYLWTPDGDTPDNYEIRISTCDYGVYIGDNSYITLRDLEILHSGTDGVRITKGDYNTLENLTIDYPDLTGVDISLEGTNNVVNHCTVFGSNARGICTYGNNTTITNNVVEQTGQLLSINKATYEHDTNTGTAIYTRGDNHVIEYNRLINSGYHGINFQGINVSVKYNYINGACQSLGDGGGIYCFKGTPYADNSRTVGSVIANNIVLNSYGNPAGAIKGYGDGFGIYLDGGGKGIKVLNNTVAGTTSGAMYVNGGGGENVVDNNLFMNSILLLRANANKGEVEIKNNLFYQTDRKGTYGWSRINPTHQRFVFQLNGAAFLFDNNTYVAHYNTAGVFMGGYSDFNEWKMKTGQDTHSTFDGSPLNEGETEKLFYNDSKDKKVFELGDTIYRNLNGKQVEGILTINPFESTILIKLNHDTNN